MTPHVARALAAVRMRMPPAVAIYKAGRRAVVDPAPRFLLPAETERGLLVRENRQPWSPLPHVPLADFAAGVALRGLVGLDPAATALPRGTWARVIAIAAAILEDRPLPPHWGSVAHAPDLFQRYRDIVDQLDPLAMLPDHWSDCCWLLIDSGDCVRIRLRDGLAPGTPIGPDDVADTTRLEAPWYHPFVARVASEALPPGVDPDSVSMEGVLARLARGPILGTGRYAGYRICYLGSKVAIELDAGPPFLMEVEPGSWIAWTERIIVSIAFGLSDLASLDWTAVVARGEHRPVPWCRRVSPTSRHPFVNPSSGSVCMADTSIRYAGARQAHGGLRPADVEVQLVRDLLSCRLLAAKRVLRYGFRASNPMAPWRDNDPRSLLRQARERVAEAGPGASIEPFLPWAILTTAEATALAARVPGLEMVRWEG